MTRLKSSTFAGAPARIASVDASILKRLVRNVAGDLALIYDKLTGENGETSTIDHSGGPRGAPLNLPLIMQEIHKPFTQPIGMVAKYIGDTYLLAAPVRVVAGSLDWVLEADIDFVVASPRDSHVNVVLIDDTGAETNVPFDLSDPGEGEGSRITAPITFAATGTYVVGVTARPRLTSEADSFFLVRWRLRQAANASSTNDTAGFPATGLGEAYDVATTINAVAGIDEIQAIDDGPLDGKVLVDLTRWLQSMTEYVMGGPLPGNEDRTVTQEWHHDGSVFASEPQPAVPIFAECLGAVLATGGAVVTAGGATGALDWCAPFLLVAVPSPGMQAVARKQIYLPDFDASPSKLKAVILAASGAGTPTAWKADVQTGAGNAADVSFVQVGSTVLYVADVDAIPFTPGAINDVLCRIQSDAAVAHDELQVVGWCLYFEA